MYKAIVFFDLDGTLFNNKKEVSPENLAAISALQKNNILPVISTGRNIFEIKDLMAQTGIDTVVSANGGLVIYEGAPLFAQPIDKTTLEAISKQAKADGYLITYYNSKHFAASGHNQLLLSNYQALHQPAPDIDEAFYRHNPVVMMLLFIPEDQDNGEQARYEEMFDQKLTFYRNGFYALDVVKKNVSKKTGLMSIINNAGLKGVPTYAFGDGNNDVPMFEGVDYPIAMGNSVPAVLAVAKYVTASNLDNGIPKALRHYGLID